MIYLACVVSGGGAIDVNDGGLEGSFDGLSCVDTDFLQKVNQTVGLVYVLGIVGLHYLSQLLPQYLHLVH